VTTVARPAPQGADRRYLAIGALVLLGAAAVSLFVGVSGISPADLLAGDAQKRAVLLESRIPRLAAIVLAGSAMGVAGLIMQGLTQNRFVAPSTAGTIESATFGVLVATLWFGSGSVFAKMTLAVLFALVGTAIFLALVERLRFSDIIVVPLVGIMFGAVVGAATMFFAFRADLLQTLSAWTTADFSGTLRGRYELLWLVGGLTVLAYRYADRFTVAGMGRDHAVNLGVDHRRTVTLGLALVAAVSAVVVVVVGAIPFLGLVAPNITTLLVGDNMRRVLPVTALSGALFLLACDILSRTIRYPFEVPVGTVVGVLGGAVFVFLIFRSRFGAAAA